MDFENKNIMVQLCVLKTKCAQIAQSTDQKLSLQLTFAIKQALYSTS